MTICKGHTDENLAYHFPNKLIYIKKGALRICFAIDCQ